jgi:hypothetical protein
MRWIIAHVLVRNESQLFTLQSDYSEKLAIFNNPD